MAFTANLEMVNKIAKITLSGELDASSAPIFRDEVEKTEQYKPKRLVLMLSDLEFIASAGIRVLIFAKQKMGADVDVFAVAPQDQVRETMEMTGLNYSIQVLDTYDAAVIEKM